MAFATVVNMSATARQLFSSYERQTARDRVLKAPPPRTHSLGCFFVSIGFKKGLIKTNARVIKHYDCYFHSYKFWSSPNYVKTARFNGPYPNALDLSNLRLTNHIWISWCVNNRVLFWSKNLRRSILYEWKTDFTVDTNIGAQSLHRPYLFDLCLCATPLVGVYHQRSRPLDWFYRGNPRPLRVKPPRLNLYFGNSNFSLIK